VHTRLTTRINAYKRVPAPTRKVKKFPLAHVRGWYDCRIYPNLHSENQQANAFLVNEFHLSPQSFVAWKPSRVVGGTYLGAQPMGVRPF